MSDLFTPAMLAGMVIALVAGSVRGFTGFGSGLVMAPPLIHLMGPARAVPIVILLDMAASIRLLPGAVGRTRWRTILPMGAAACVMIPVGNLVLSGLDRRRALLVVSAVVLGFVCVLTSGWRYRHQPTGPLTMAVGTASGFLTGLGGIGGPPVILFLLSGPWQAPEARAGFISFFGITQMAALIVLAHGGLLTFDVFAWMLILLPFFLVGIQGGVRLFHRFGESAYRGVVLGILAGIALGGIILGSV